MAKASAKAPKQMEVIAAILHPFLSEENHWTLLHHPLFQTYFYGSHVGIDPNGRDAYRDSPYFDQTAEFCALYDEVSFDTHGSSGTVTATPTESATSTNSPTASATGTATPTATESATLTASNTVTVGIGAVQRAGPLVQITVPGQVQAGALFGAAYLRGILLIRAPEWRLLTSGLGVLLVLLVLPGGLLGLWARIRDIVVGKLTGVRPDELASAEPIVEPAPAAASEPEPAEVP